MPPSKLRISSRDMSYERIPVGIFCWSVQIHTRQTMKYIHIHMKQMSLHMLHLRCRTYTVCWVLESLSNPHPSLWLASRLALENWGWYTKARKHPRIVHVWVELDHHPSINTRDWITHCFLNTAPRLSKVGSKNRLWVILTLLSISKEHAQLISTLVWPHDIHLQLHFIIEVGLGPPLDKLLSTHQDRCLQLHHSCTRL